MRKRVLGIVLLTLWICLPGRAQTEKGIQIVRPEQAQEERLKRWAVLIGVDKYRDSVGIGSLKYCGADMKLLHRVLTGPHGGFAPENVLLMTDDASDPGHRPTYSNIVTMVPRWLCEAEPDDDVLIAFSGHGITEKGEAYLVPSTARFGNLALTAVSMRLVRQWMDACKAGRKILIVDACHAGAGKAAATMDRKFWQDVDRGEGFVKLASCGPRQKSNEDERLTSPVGKGHGVFTYYLAEGLDGLGDFDRNGRVDVDEAYRYTFKKTRQWARNKGIRQDPLKSGRVTGVMTIAYYRAPTEVRGRRWPQPPTAPGQRRDHYDLVLFRSGRIMECEATEMGGQVSIKHKGRRMTMPRSLIKEIRYGQGGAKPEVSAAPQPTEQRQELFGPRRPESSSLADARKRYQAALQSRDPDRQALLKHSLTRYGISDSRRHDQPKYYRAWQLIEKKRYRSALKLLEENIRDYPTTGNIDYEYAQAARCAAHLGDWDKTVRYYKVVRERFSGWQTTGGGGAQRNWENMLSEIRSLANSRAGRDSKAKEALEEIRKLDEAGFQRFLRNLSKE